MLFKGVCRPLKNTSGLAGILPKVDTETVFVKPLHADAALELNYVQISTSTTIKIWEMKKKKKVNFAV